MVFPVPDQMELQIQHQHSNENSFCCLDLQLERVSGLQVVCEQQKHIATNQHQPDEQEINFQLLLDYGINSVVLDG